MEYSVGYIIRFAAVVCVVCAVFVSGAAVVLKERQEDNRLLDRYEKVLSVAQLVKADEDLGRDQIKERFAQFIETKVVDLASGDYVSDVDANTFDQRKAAKDPTQSREAPPNDAKVLRVPNRAVVYLVRKGDSVEQVILPIEGKGLWSTLYGFLALDADAQTVRGITYYEHGETPGLGGEVDNPRWKALWSGRKAFGTDASGNVTRDVKLQVIKGAAGPAQSDPHRVDGLSGATITSRGVTHMIAFWLGPDGFGPYLEKLRASHRSTL